MKYLLVVLLLLCFWLVWVFLPDRRGRWQHGYSPSGLIHDDESTGSSNPSPTVSAPYVAPKTPGLAYTTGVTTRSAPPRPDSNTVLESTDADSAAAATSGAHVDASPDNIPNPISSPQPQAETQRSDLSNTSSATSKDDLTRIKGIGKVLESKLHDLGITTFLQIADFTAEDIARVDAVLNFKGRIEREKWVEQAKGFIAQV